ncbi:MAG: S9 family peptidase [Acidobacteriota bacterium]|nr:S9 family peptidase [Acidobacteriota bacterium]
MRRFPSRSSQLWRSGTAFLALVVAVPLLAPAVSAERMTPEDVARVRLVVEARISPDGQRVAYALAVPRQPGKDENGPAWTELHVAASDGTGHRTFVGGDVNVSHLRWSPDGSLISYLARRGDDEHAAIYGIPLGGGESFKVVEHETGVTSFDWRPDGKAIAFVAQQKQDEDKKKQQDDGFNQEIYEEDWHSRLVHVADVRLDASEETHDVRTLEGLPGQAWHVAFSPDGRALAVDLSPTPLIDERYMFRRIHIIDAESGEVRAKIDNPGKLGPLRWSPDGTSIVMISAADINDPKEGRLLAASATGGPLRDLLPGLADKGHVEDFRCAGDGSIVFLASVGVSSRIGRVPLSGGEPSWIYEGDGASAPVLSAISLDAGGSSLAVVAESPRHPPEAGILSAARKGQGRVRRLTTSNPWLEEVELGRQEIVEYAARDGLTIQGLLIHPVDRARGARVPLIVVAHGGPEAHYRNGWLTRYSYPGHVGAGRGYALFYPNYRGSTGRGVAFSKADQGDGGGKEFLDVLDGVEHVVELGLADRGKVGITGGSYGGFFTALGSTRYSEHFAAGVMFVGISNQLSKAGTTDIPREMELVHWRTYVFDDLELFLDRSPVMHVDKAKTPLLILHGKEDPRVDPGQSRELYRALKLKGDVPVRLVLYPGEGHGNRKAAARFDYSLRMLRWFDHFLAGDGTAAPPFDLDYGLEDEDDDEGGEHENGDEDDEHGDE